MYSAEGIQISKKSPSIDGRRTGPRSKVRTASIHGTMAYAIFLLIRIERLEHDGQIPKSRPIPSMSGSVVSTDDTEWIVSRI